MNVLGAATLLVIGSASMAVAAVAIYHGRIWCVPRGFEWKARWVRRSREGTTFWSNALGIGAIGAACVVAGCRALFRAG